MNGVRWFQRALFLPHQPTAVSVGAADEPGATRNGEVSVGPSDLPGSVFNAEKKSKNTTLALLSLHTHLLMWRKEESVLQAWALILFPVFNNTFLCPLVSFGNDSWHWCEIFWHTLSSFSIYTILKIAFPSCLLLTFFFISSYMIIYFAFVHYAVFVHLPDQSAVIFQPTVRADMQSALPRYRRWCATFWKAPTRRWPPEGTSCPRWRASAARCQSWDLMMLPWKQGHKWLTVHGESILICSGNTCLIHTLSWRAEDSKILFHFDAVCVTNKTLKPLQAPIFIATFLTSCCYKVRLDKWRPLLERSSRRGLGGGVSAESDGSTSRRQQPRDLVPHNIVLVTWTKVETFIAKNSKLRKR